MRPRAKATWSLYNILLPSSNGNNQAALTALAEISLGGKLAGAPPFLISFMLPATRTHSASYASRVALPAHAAS